MITKPKKRSKIGIKFDKRHNGTLFISFIRPGGIVDQSELMLYDDIKSVNGMECKGKEPREVVRYIRSLTTTITFTRMNKVSDCRNSTRLSRRNSLVKEVQVLPSNDGSFECHFDTFPLSSKDEIEIIPMLDGSLECNFIGIAPHR